MTLLLDLLLLAILAAYMTWGARRPNAYELCVAWGL